MGKTTEINALIRVSHLYKEDDINYVSIYNPDTPVLYHWRQKDP
jgi:hypothetical protein